MKICLLLQDCKPDHTPVAATQQHRVGKREVPHFIEFKSTKSTTEHTIGSLRDACRLHDAAVAPSVTSLSHGRNADDFMSLLVRSLKPAVGYSNWLPYGSDNSGTLFAQGTPPRGLHLGELPNPWSVHRLYLLQRYRYHLSVSHPRTTI